MPKEFIKVYHLDQKDGDTPFISTLTAVRFEALFKLNPHLLGEASHPRIDNILTVKSKEDRLLRVYQEQAAILIESVIVNEEAKTMTVKAKPFGPLMEMALSDDPPVTIGIRGFSIPKTGEIIHIVTFDIIPDIQGKSK